MDKLLHTSLGAQTQLTDGYFNGPSDSEQEIDNSTLVDENGLGIWSGDQPARSVRYNYATEKSMSHVDAKLFYQQHRLEASRQDTEPSIPMAQPETSPLNSSENLEGLSRGASTSSRRSLSRNVPKESTMPMRPLGSDKLTSNRDPSSAVLSRSDAHTALSRAEAKIDDINSSNHPMEHQSSGADTEFGAQGMNSSNIAPEMRAICTSIKEVLSIRRNYIKLSLQTSHDNPKDQDGWKIYPPPPEPVWDDIKNRPRNQTSGTSSLVNSTVLSSDQYPTSSPVIGGITHEVPLTPTTKTRKPGVNVGEDFELSDLLPLPKESGDTTFKLDKHGVFQVYEGSKSVEINSPNFFVPTLRDFYKDLEYVKNVSSDGPSKSFAYRELDILEGKFNLYFLMKEYEETATCKRVPHRDFYNVRKVDTHVHHSSCMNQKHLLRFIKSKMKKSPDEIVLFRDGKHLTLTEVFESINLTAYDLSIDTLDMHAHSDSFHRFDKFNLKYNPVGESRLREIFLKTDNLIRGRYLAELTKEVIADIESSKYQMVEWRISIYGRTLQEWDKLAAWVVDNKLISHNIRWLVQIPRLYHVYKIEGRMETFEEIIINVFQPLFEVTQNPSSHPKLHIFLQRVVGFDSVDDESKTEPRFHKKFPRANEWNSLQNPPYSYWIYHLFANMTSLNNWRKQREFNTFVLRPHCGEAGDLEHLAVAALCCHSISHGLLLRKAPLLQYIFYLDQIGIAMSPLSNNALFLTYERNPFPKYFRRGLNVSLSTDDPLQIAFTKEPLIEEYSVAAQIYKLSAVDMCELAQHSVMQSGFERQLKQRWLGPDFDLPGVKGNNVAKSNVPDIREVFRQETLIEQLAIIERYSAPLRTHANSTSSQFVPPSPSSSLTRINATNIESPIFPTRAIRPSGSHSNIDIKDMDARHMQKNKKQQQQGEKGLERSLSLILPPAAIKKNCWHDETVEPRIFPGLVHEKTRKMSMCHGSDSENEPDLPAESLAESLKDEWKESDKARRKT